MNLFAEYVQPLTSWMQVHPHWSLFITFIISLTESLVIIGSIIPGSITMTAIGILAGSGVMRIDFTLLAAVLGAIIGDSISYTIGHLYSDKIMDVWPFRNYPSWFKYGRNFFIKHGGKSVLLGRFIGPLRSLIPVIAGIMHMKQLRFFTANVISAIGWALLYVMPGVILGAASNELSGESATRLFLAILILLGTIWFLSVVLKWVLVKLHYSLGNYLNNLWCILLNRTRTAGLFHLITPADEENHYTTAALFIGMICSLLAFVVIFVLSITESGLMYFNQPVGFLFQSLRTPFFDSAFIFCSQFTSIYTIASLFICFCIWFYYIKHLKAIAYLISLLFFSSLIALFSATYLHTIRLFDMTGTSLLNVNLEMATAFYGFILFYINNNNSIARNTLRTLIIMILGLSGFASMYLGNYQLTEVLCAYFSGMTVCIIHCIIYRKNRTDHIKNSQSLLMLFTIACVVFASALISTSINFKTLKQEHTTLRHDIRLDQQQWWNQSYSLPLYVYSRLGKRISLLNIQYYGDLNTLELTLNKNGWKPHNESFYTKLLWRLTYNSSKVKLPLLDQLYENKRPALVMTYTTAQSGLILELRMWQSNYYFSPNNPLWIGSLHISVYANKQRLKNINHLPINSLSYLIPALKEFTARRIPLEARDIKPTLLPFSPYILLIKGN